MMQMTPMRFGGETATRLAGQAYLPPEVFEPVVRADTDPYIGRFPKALLSALELSEAEAFKTMDELVASFIHQVKPRLGLDVLIPWKHREFEINGKPVRLEFLDAGAYGNGFKLTAGDEAYLLKVFCYERDGKWGGPFQEIANGELFTSHGVTKNTSRFHCGNPLGRWLIDEFITPDTCPEDRPGETYQAFMIRQGLVNADTENPGNVISGVLVDRGGIRPFDPEADLNRPPKHTDN